MKKKSFFFIILLLTVTGIEASQQYDNLAKLIKSGAKEEVVIAYINASDSSYNLTSNEIVQLKEYGASSNIIIAVIQHKGSVIAASNSQAPRETSSVIYPRSYVYRVGPYWRPWRAPATYWNLKNIDKMNQALQIDVAGFFEGAITLNYEYLLFHQHGIVLEGSYYSGWGWDSHGENAELAYRWHWARRMNSGFLGAFINYGKNHGNERDIWGDTSVSYTQKSITVGPDIGKRWITPWGLSVVGRIGYGYTWSKFNNPAPDQRTINRLRWASGFDSELSVGYAF